MASFLEENGGGRGKKIEGLNGKIRQKGGEEKGGGPKKRKKK